MSAVTSAPSQAPTASTAGEEKSMLNDFIVSLSSKLVHAQADIAHTMCWLPSALALDGSEDNSVTQAQASTVPSERKLIENTAVQEPLQEAVVREDIDQALADMGPVDQPSDFNYLQEDVDSALEDLAQREEHAVSLDAKEASVTADETVPVVSDVDPKTTIVAKEAGETADTVLISTNDLRKGLDTKAKKGLGAKAKNWFLGCSQASTAEPKAAKQKASKAPKAKSAAPAA